MFHFAGMSKLNWELNRKFDTFNHNQCATCKQQQQNMQTIKSNIQKHCELKRNKYEWNKTDERANQNQKKKWKKHAIERKEFAA